MSFVELLWCVVWISYHRTFNPDRNFWDTKYILHENVELFSPPSTLSSVESRESSVPRTSCAGYGLQPCLGRVGENL